jgi:hypothetical protein
MLGRDNSCNRLAFVLDNGLDNGLSRGSENRGYGVVFRLCWTLLLFNDGNFFDNRFSFYYDAADGCFGFDFDGSGGRNNDRNARNGIDSNRFSSATFKGSFLSAVLGAGSFLVSDGFT